MVIRREETLLTLPSIFAFPYADLQECGEVRLSLGSAHIYFSFLFLFSLSLPQGNRINWLTDTAQEGPGVFVSHHSTSEWSFHNMVMPITKCGLDIGVEQVRTSLLSFFVSRTFKPIQYILYSSGVFCGVLVGSLLFCFRVWE